MAQAVSFLDALEAVRKDQPGVADVHVESAGGGGKTPKRKKAQTFAEVAAGCAPGQLAKTFADLIAKFAVSGLPHPHIGNRTGRRAKPQRSMDLTYTTRPKDANPMARHGARRVTGWARKRLDPDLQISVDITKADDEKRQVFGWASVIEKDGQPVVDHQDDMITIDELEPAAYDFVAKSREGDDMHVGGPVSHLIESMVFTKEKQAALGIDLGKVAWWTGWQIDDPAVWEAHKRGERPELSIGGSAVREKVR